MLSKDIVTNFRDRGSEIKVYPLSFKEFYPVSGLEKVDAMEEYLTYGGMPLAVLEKNETEIASDGERDLRRAHPQRLQRGCRCGGNDPRKGRQKATVTV